MLAATPTNTLRRPDGAPNGMAISTTTTQVHGAASRACLEHELAHVVEKRPVAIRPDAALGKQLAARAVRQSPFHVRIEHFAGLKVVGANAPEPVVAIVVKF